MNAPNAASEPPRWTAEELIEGIRRALEGHDMPAVAGMLRLLAVEDPQAAELILLVIDLASAASP